MSLRPFLSLLVKALDVGLELRPVDTPHAPPSDLDRRELSGADQGVDLGNADREIRRYVFQSEKARFDLGSAVAGAGVGLGHPATIAPDHLGYLHLASFAAVCCASAVTDGGPTCR